MQHTRNRNTTGEHPAKTLSAIRGHGGCHVSFFNFNLLITYLNLPFPFAFDFAVIYSKKTAVHFLFPVWCMAIYAQHHA